MNRPATHRAIATSAPTAAQVDTFHKLMTGAIASIVAQFPEERRAQMFALAHAEIARGVAGKPVPESTARMVAHGFRTVGVGAVVEEVSA